MASHVLSIDGFSVRVWKNIHGSKNPPRGYIWINHGLGEHSGRYDSLAQFMCSFGWDVVAPDMPGHGLTKKLGKFVNLIGPLDIIPLLNGIAQSLSRHELIGEGSNFVKAPKILAGHSMGSMISATWLCSEGSVMEGFEWKSAFLSAPPIKLKMVVPEWKAQLAKVFEKLAPNFKIGNEISTSDLSVDPANRSEYDADPLVHSNASPRLFLGLQYASKFVMSRAKMIEIPVCLAVAKQDPIVDPEGVRAFFEEINTHKKYLEFPQSLHEIFNDVEKKLVYDAFLKWCAQ